MAGSGKTRFHSPKGWLAVMSMDRRLLLDDAASAGRARTRMALHKINALHQQPGFPRHGAQNRARLALVAAGRYDALVAFPDLHRHHSPSGARAARKTVV